MDSHYNAAIHRRLSQLFDNAEWDSLVPYLDSLSNAHFRTAGYLMGERLLQATDRETFWLVARRLVAWQPKAFTVTMAKAAAARLRKGTLAMDDEGFLALCADLQDPGRQLDREKWLLQWLPLAGRPETIAALLDNLGIGPARRRTDFLLRTPGLAAGFVLLRTLRFEEHDRPFLLQTCRQLIKRADDLSYNLASLVKEFFGLSELKGVFSLRLQPYELSRIDTDFETFCRIVTRV